MQPLKSSLKILHVVPSVSPVRGGATTAVLEMVRSLLGQGVETEIITTNDDGEGVLDVPLGQPTTVEGIPVTFFPRWSPPVRALSEFAISLDHTRWLKQNLHHWDLLVIHAVFSHVCTAAGGVARQQKRPYVITPHGQFSPWVIQQKTRKKVLYYRLFEAANLQQATALHCTTTAEVRNVRAFGLTAPTFTIPLGVTLPLEIENATEQLRQTYQIPNDRSVLLFLSRFHPKKRPDFLLSVLAQLPPDLPFHLILAGDGDPDYRAYLQDIIQQQGLTDRVTLPGFLSGEPKALALYGADLFVLPSYGENFGIAVAEAMAAGLPVMVTPEVEIADEISAAQAGWVIPGTEADWIDTLAQILPRSDWRQQRGQQGKQLANDRYQWSKIGQQLIHAYQRSAGK